MVNILLKSIIVWILWISACKHSHCEIIITTLLLTSCRFTQLQCFICFLCISFHDLCEVWWIYLTQYMNIVVWKLFSHLNHHCHLHYILFCSSVLNFTESSIRSTAKSSLRPSSILQASLYSGFHYRSKHTSIYSLSVPLSFPSKKKISDSFFFFFFFYSGASGDDLSIRL